MTQNLKSWWLAEKESVHASALPYVSAVEEAQFDLFDKFVKLEAMYDPNAAHERGIIGAPAGWRVSGNVVENVVASNIDTVTAIISATEVRARFMTDDADWSQQRRAKHLEWYADGLSAKYDVDELCKLAFRDAALKGTGALKIYADDDDRVCIDLVPIDDLVVDEAEARNGKPKQMHQRLLIDREELKAQFPDHEEAIDAAHSQLDARLWANYRPFAENEVVALESWRLPRGKRGTDGYRPGRHVISIEGADLLDEEWHDETFPFVIIRWSSRTQGWYGIGLAERIAAIQLALNKRNWQIDRLLNQAAAPTTYVRMADAAMAVKTETNGRASIVPYVADKPETVFPPLVNPEVYASRLDLKNSAFEESGVSRLTSQAAKPAGLDSGAALRQYRDATTQRFALQEQAYERLKLDVITALLGVCKKLGANAPKVTSTSRFGRMQIEWSKVDMGDVKVQIAAASTISKTPAGRTQTVLEWAQAGIISQDQAKRLLDHPDLEREMSLMTAAIESVEWCLELILDGEVVVPEPFMNLELCVVRGQHEYLRVSAGDEKTRAPEDILEALRTFIVQAAYRPAPPANANMPMDAAAPGAMPGDPAAGGALPPLASMPAAPPQAALAAQAMQLRSA